MQAYKRNDVEPLRAIGSYVDTLDLSTGVITRYIRRYIFTGLENWSNQFVSTVFFVMGLFGQSGYTVDRFIPTYQSICSHFIYNLVQTNVSGTLTQGEYGLQKSNDVYTPVFKNTSFTTVSAWKTWVQDLYDNGTPLTLWYVLETPKTETIDVPSGLTGIIEGYLVQNETPTPENPVFPIERQINFYWRTTNIYKYNNGWTT